MIAYGSKTTDLWETKINKQQRTKKGKGHERTSVSLLRSVALAGAMAAGATAFVSFEAGKEVRHEEE